MTRTAAREIAVHFAFELGFTNQTAEELLAEALNRKTFEQIGEEEPLYAEFPNEKQREYISKLVKGVYEHSPELDEYISKYAIGWKYSRLNRVAIAIMRVAMYEILYMQDIPNAAAINEAVEMTKHYEEPEVVSFVNGILGSFVRNECPPEAGGPRGGGWPQSQRRSGRRTRRNMRALGIDTSNYTTSAAVFDGSGGYNAGRLLEVRPGELGLRQSDALFQHIKHLPGRFAELRAEGWLTGLSAVGASTRPRAVEGSYMPCFLAGEGQGQTLADALGVPFYAVSHQQGHIAAAAWSAGRLELLDRPMLAWHLSGGTTELLYVEPDGVNVRAQCVGGTSDISAGQLIDRTGLPFPAGKALDVLASESDLIRGFPVKLNGLTFSLSGMENKGKALAEQGRPPAEIARFTLETVASAVRRATDAARKRWPGLPVLCSGGVASNRLLRTVMSDAAFAAPQYSTDNAMGAAILAWRSLRQEAEA